MSGFLFPKAVISGAVAGFIMAGCAAGPNFHTPEAPATNAYTAEALPPETASAPGAGGASQRFVPGRDIPGEWWTLFHSAALDAVVRRALADNPTLAAAQATIRQARENVNAMVGSALYPAVDADLSATRQRISGAAFGQPGTSFSPFTLYNASVSVSYALDLFGAARRELEALQAQVEYRDFQLEAAYLTISANIVTAAVREASLRAEIKATQDIVDAEKQQLDVVEGRFQLGAVSRSDVLAQRVQLAQTQAGLPALEKALAQNRHLLAVLAGKLPNEANALPEFTLEDFELPRDLPVSLPSMLVRRRPDIRSAEALLHAASAQVGVATANLYPRITLNASYGSEVVRTGDFFTGGSEVWSLSGGLLQPLFHGGELKAQRRAAVAAYDGAAAQYRSTVLLAFQNVADVLKALDYDARTLADQAEAAKAAEDSFELARKQLGLGAVSYLTLLNAERAYREAQISLVQAQAARFADTAALFQSLGGGWWNRGSETQESGARSPGEKNKK